MIIENRPFFSVVIPLYNKQNYIKETIKSVLNQTFQDFEIVIVNDGSKDDSVKVVESIQDDRIKLVHQENSGVSVARNMGIKEANAKYIAFLDADDLWLPEFLQTIYELIQNFPDAGLYATAYKKSILKNALNSIDLSKDIRLIYGEDVLLFAEVLVKSKKIVSISEELYIYHNEESSITKIMAKDSLKRNAEQLKFIIDKLNKSKLNSKGRSYIYKIIISRLRYDQLNILNKIDISKISKLKNYIKLISINPNLKMFVKFAIFLATFEKKSL